MISIAVAEIFVYRRGWNLHIGEEKKPVKDMIIPRATWKRRSYMNFNIGSNVTHVHVWAVVAPLDLNCVLKSEDFGLRD
jgi:hypothetical protein